MEYSSLHSFRHILNDSFEVVLSLRSASCVDNYGVSHTKGRVSDQEELDIDIISHLSLHKLLCRSKTTDGNG